MMDANGRRILLVVGALMPQMISGLSHANLIEQMIAERPDPPSFDWNSVAAIQTAEAKRERRRKKRLDGLTARSIAPPALRLGRKGEREEENE